MRHILSILVENESGALSRISGLFSARGFNIESLTVAPTEDLTMSRMTIVTVGSDTDKSTPVTEQKTDVAKSDKSKFSNENSTIATVVSSTTANADAVKGQLSKRVDTDASGKTVATCKRYFPTVGQTITVPCDQ